MAPTIASIFTSLLASTFLAFFFTTSHKTIDSASSPKHTISRPPNSTPFAPTTTPFLLYITIIYPPFPINTAFPPSRLSRHFFPSSCQHHLHHPPPPHLNPHQRTRASNVPIKSRPARRTNQLAGLLHDLSTALETSVHGTQEALSERPNTKIDTIADDSTANLDRLVALNDDDFAKVHARMNLFLAQWSSLWKRTQIVFANTLPVKMSIWSFGNDVERFSLPSTSGDDDDYDDRHEAPEDVPLEDCSGLVEEWLEECAEPEECQDVFGDVQVIR